jgi:hypothetical protein
MIYFLHIRHGSELINDVKDEEFTDMRAALEAAAESARDLLIEMLCQRRRTNEVGTSVEITDEAGTVVARVELGDVAAGAFTKRRRRSRNFH